MAIVRKRLLRLEAAVLALGQPIPVPVIMATAEPVPVTMATAELQPQTAVTIAHIGRRKGISVRQELAREKGFPPPGGC